MRVLLIVLSSIIFLLSGCASTKVDVTGHSLKEPLCKLGAQPITAHVYWTTQWRADQKEPDLREAAAKRGLQDFFAHTECLSVVAIDRLVPALAIPDNEDMVAMSAAQEALPDRVILVVVRELGPTLTIGIPVIVTGGAEVLIDVRVLDPRAQGTLANTRTFWLNGGVFVIKGVKTLDQDLSHALNATHMELQDNW